MRVSQLDSHLLDGELLALLSANIDSALSLFSSVDLVSVVSKTVLRAVIWKIGIWDNDNTYGSQLQSLRYMNLTRNKKLVLGFFSVFGPLIQEKIGGELHGRWRRIVAHAEGIYEVLALANFISYIAGSRYDSVLHRALKVQLRPINSAYRAVSFEFLNRQLIWSQFTEFLLVFLPLINLPRLKRKLTGYLPQPGVQRLDFLPKKVCAICFSEKAEGADCVNPYEADCGHVYCYGCVMSQIKLSEGEGWGCLRCGHEVHKARPWFESSGYDQTSQLLLNATRTKSGSVVSDDSDQDESEGDDDDDDEAEDDESIYEKDTEDANDTGE